MDLLGSESLMREAASPMRMMPVSWPVSIAPLAMRNWKVARVGSSAPLVPT